MEGFYGSTVDQIEHIVTSTGNTSMFCGPLFDDGGGGGGGDDHDDNDQGLKFEKMASDSENTSDLIKIQIAKHPGYPDLVAAYIECQKVGAPPEKVSLLEEIRRENHTLGLGAGSSSQIGADPELDNFMESYREILQRFREELSKQFNEATVFVSNIQSQLNNLCEGAFTKILDDHSDHEAAGTDSDDQKEIMAPYGEVDNELERPESCEQDSYGVGVVGEQAADIKEMLLRKYSGYLTMLKTEFLKKRKKVELPKPARATLLEWRNDHHMWPYPSKTARLTDQSVPNSNWKSLNQLVFFAILVSTIGVWVDTHHSISSRYS
ncbi:Homeobox protein knotted-1-like 1 [Morus notabilis]|uniref:Homeobox protein knotted-1-like 1 n=1 Tax=Morus notabilis TaxID=981085 RepID=W9SND4_9ROSA|nr:Homeobox protein knotted-1-like 1 [Morus notabilis]